MCECVVLCCNTARIRLKLGFKTFCLLMDFSQAVCFLVCKSLQGYSMHFHLWEIIHFFAVINLNLKQTPSPVLHSYQPSSSCRYRQINPKIQQTYFTGI